MTSCGSRPLGNGGDPFLRIDGVTKKFGSVTAVDNVSLDIARGELFCLLGSSGCGKTTLLRMLAGFETPNSGTIKIDGTDVADVPPYRRPTNMMFQSYALFPHMSVAKNIAYGLERGGAAKSEIRVKVAQMLEMVQMSEFGKRKPHQLSGGQRQRVALVRALAKNPKLLLLDEPLGALDKKLREETRLELVNIQQRLGVTFVVVTHDQEEAMAIATRIGIMASGRISQVGTAREIYEFPGSRFVADFIGSVNIFEATVVAEEKNFVHLRSAEAGCDIHVGHGISCTPNQRMWYALRPEKVTLTRAKPDGVVNTVPGTVEEISYLGSNSLYHLSLATGKRVIAARTNFERVAEDDIRTGEQAYVSWEPTAGVVLSS